MHKNEYILNFIKINHTIAIVYKFLVIIKIKFLIIVVQNVFYRELTIQIQIEKRFIIAKF
ncbi:MAG: hypothetical protein ETSY1_27265 [Candidatus Entotheonella factor]|uniref:Transmembrane protein n=1 Tax=Entotheonella factor TaxID=1429438 RepID=W4LG36_ENTF1|nr:MAG: hypothetical protein ETSY1_27265 [Candidatus Entotheonella factor]